MEEQPAQFVAVLDAGGFVGAFASVDAAHAALAAFGPRHYAATKHPRRCPEGASVWVLPYRWLSPVAIACVSDDREVTAAAQAALSPLGLVDSDDLKYWEQAFGEIAPAALQRLREPPGGDPASLETHLFGAPEGVNAGLPPEEVKINLLESVVAAPLPGVDPPPG